MKMPLKLSPLHALILILVAALGVLAGGSGCMHVSSTMRRAGVVALGSGGAAAGAYAATDRDKGAAMLAAIGGAAATHLALGEDSDVRQRGFDEGYIQGQSDAIKRQYFLRHALEAEPLPDATNTKGETVYYLVPGPEVTADGRKLEPHQVAVRVVE